MKNDSMILTVSRRRHVRKPYIDCRKTDPSDEVRVEALTLWHVRHKTMTLSALHRI